MIVVSYIFACLIALLAIFFVWLLLSRYKTYANKIIFIAIAFGLGVVMFSFLYIPYQEGNAFALFFSAINSSVKMFALGNDDTIFENVVLSSNNALFAKIFVRYIAQFGAFAIASATLISTYYKTFLIKNRSFQTRWNHFRKIDSSNKKAYTINYVYTDLSYNNLKPFLENLKSDNKAITKVVLSSSFTAVKAGQELTELLKINGFEIVKEGFDYIAMKRLSSPSRSYKVKFYSLFSNDKDNLTFADTALKFYSKYVKVKQKDNKKTQEYSIDKYDVYFYVSFQDETFNNKTEYSNLSNGRIQLVSECAVVASRFVFENPITRFIDLKQDSFEKVLKSEKNIHVHFIGFGNINKKMAAKMLPNYMLPFDDSQVTYHIASLNAIENKDKEAFLSNYQFIKKEYSREEYYEQFDLEKMFIEHNLNATKDNELYDYASLIVDIVENVGGNESSAKNIIIVSTGDEQRNVNIALKLRNYIINISAARKDSLIKDSRYKSAIIYPYLNDNEFFKQSNNVFINVVKALINDNKPEDITYEMVSEKIHDYAKKENKNFYNNYLSFSFETNYNKEFNGVEVLKNIDKPTVFKLFDFYHDAAFEFEEVPIVNFGRGGFLSDSFYDALTYLAKQINASYSNCTNDYEIEAKWNKLSYQDQQSNIGAALSLPMKANVLGYDLVWDKKDNLERFVMINSKGNKNTEKKNYKEFLDVFKKCYPSYSECYETYINEDISKLDIVKDITGLNDNFEQALKNNKNIISYLNISGELKALINNDKVTLEKIKKSFASLYKKPYEDYLANKANEEEIIKIKQMFKDYYEITYRSILTDKFITIKNIEHNRWMIDKCAYGIVPRKKKFVTFDYSNNKSHDLLRLLCVTTNNGLEEIGYDCIDKIVESRNVAFSSSNNENYVPSFDDFDFSIKNDDSSYLYKIYKVNYYYDAFQYNVLIRSILKNFKTIDEKNPSIKKHTFILRKKNY